MEGEVGHTYNTLFCLMLGSYFPILVVPVAPYQNRIESFNEAKYHYRIQTTTIDNPNPNPTGVSHHTDMCGPSRLTSSLPWLTSEIILTELTLLQASNAPLRVLFFFFFSFVRFKIKSTLTLKAWVKLWTWKKESMSSLQAEHCL